MSEFNKSASEGVAELKKLQEQKMQEAADGKSQEKGNGLVFTTELNREEYLFSLDISSLKEDQAALKAKLETAKVNIRLEVQEQLLALKTAVGNNYKDAVIARNTLNTIDAGAQCIMV